MKKRLLITGSTFPRYENAVSYTHLDVYKRQQKHFMKLVKPNDHKFAALHGAVWSGGSFVYVPKGDVYKRQECILSGCA